jgi:hypothetical protein
MVDGWMLMLEDIGSRLARMEVSEVIFCEVTFCEVFVGECGVCGELWGNVGFVARPHALRILGSSGKNEKKEKVIWPIRARLTEHPKSGNLCENVSLLQT